MTEQIRAAAKNGRAEIYIYDDIGGDLFGDGIKAKDVAGALKSMPDAAELDLFINSYGGSVFEGLAIFNVLRRHPAKITAHIDGIAASAASIIAMAGDEIRIAANGFLMIHEAWGVATGTAEAMRRAAVDIDAASESIAKTYASRRAGTNIDRIKSWMAEETWFNAEQALAANLVDGITDANRVAAFIPPSKRFQFVHLPESLSNSIAEGVSAPTEQVTEPDQPVELTKRAVELATLSLKAKQIRQHSAPVTGRNAAATPKAKQ